MTRHHPQTEDANHSLTFVDHRQPADLQYLHVPYSFAREIVIFPAAMNAWGHDITRRGALCVEVVLGQPFADDIAVGHHADQLVVLANGRRPISCLSILFAEISDRRIWTDPIDAFVHRFFDFHGGSPVLNSPCPVWLHYTAKPVL